MSFLEKKDSQILKLHKTAFDFVTNLEVIEELYIISFDSNKIGLNHLKKSVTNFGRFGCCLKELRVTFDCGRRIRTNKSEV